MKKIVTMLVVLAMVLSFAGIGVMAEDTVVSSVQPTQAMLVDLLNKKQLTGNDAWLFTQLSGNKQWDDVAVVEFNIPNIDSLSAASLEFQSYWEKPTTNYVEVYATGAKITKGDGEATANAVNSSTLALAGKLLRNENATATTQARTVVLDTTVLKTNAENGILTLVVKIPNITTRTTKITSNFVSAKMNVTYSTSDTKFSVSDAAVTLTAMNPVVYNYTKSTQVNVTNNMIVTNTPEDGYNRVFVTFDLTGIDKTKIEKATFKNAGYRNAGEQYLKITKVTAPFNTADNTYTLDENSSVKSTAFDWQKWYKVTADLTTMIKNCEGNSLTVCIENESGSGRLQFAVTSYYNQNPAIDLVFASETVTELSTLAEGSTVTAERYVVKGSTDAPISAIPIIALYEDSELADVQIGDAVTLDGSGQTVSVSIAVTEAISNPKATMFLWTSLSELVPVLNSNSIE